MRIKKIDIKKFRERGYLQELNRQFLHPLGLALEVNINENGDETLGGVWDYRDDPEGIIFALSELNALFVRKAETVQKEMEEKMKTRFGKLQYFVQPVPGEDDVT